jgi:hypothetical protein
MRWVDIEPRGCRWERWPRGCSCHGRARPGRQKVLRIHRIQHEVPCACLDTEIGGRDPHRRRGHDHGLGDGPEPRQVGHFGAIADLRAPRRTQRNDASRPKARRVCRPSSRDRDGCPGEVVAVTRPESGTGSLCAQGLPGHSEKRTCPAFGVLGIVWRVEEYSSGKSGTTPNTTQEE